MIHAKKKNMFNIRNFHVGLLNREFLIFFFFLIISCIFWFINTMNNTYETEVLVPVELTDIPENVVITSDIDESVHVTIRDKGINLLRHFLPKEAKPISLSFETYSTNNYKGVVPSSVLTQQVRHLFKDAQILSLKPERLEFFYNYGENKKVPIVVKGKISTESRCYLSDSKITPDSIIVYAEGNILDSIKYVQTRDINLKLSTDTISLQTSLRPIKGAKFVPEMVSVTFCPDIYTTDIIKVPIRCINIPEGKTMRTFPSKAAVKFISGMKNIRRISPSDFEVIANFSEIPSDTSSHCHLMLIGIPDDVIKAQLLTTNVDFLIEE